ncbi:bifunctional phosphoribosylaminoimidazolecarboxamide formyltransferase/IMP cyclohydrolase [Elusimicrobiota bacterium]
MVKINKALISVSDKTGLVEFAEELKNLGINLISSGGTAKTLSQNAIKCEEISDVTGFPEILDGRVKTLNPKIHGGILAVRAKKSHLSQMQKHSIELIDIVVANLYPFEETIAKLKVSSEKIPQDAIENIDIGGVALLRAAAKNFSDVLVVCDTSDYKTVLEKIKSNSVSYDFRLELASKAFRHTAYYDSLISGFFTKEKFPSQMSLPLKRVSSLRYGENPHQDAAVFSQGVGKSSSIISARQIQGKELSYNNYMDLESAWRIVNEFSKTACAIIKHNNPCGCAEGRSVIDAYKKALSCDSVSAFGGIVAVNKEIDEKTAIEIIKLFTECIIAPSYNKKALKVFESKKNLRVLVQPKKYILKKEELEYRGITDGMLVQVKDNALSNALKVVSKRKTTSIENESLIFAWKICKHVKSNAIILVRGTQAVGIGAGQMSRIDSLKIAVQKMKEAKIDINEKKFPLVLASDAFFPFPDVVNESAKIGVKAIIQPGGSIKDNLSIEASNTHDIAMVLTGMRHFRH